MPLDQRQRHPRRHQRILSRASHCHFTFLLMLASCLFLSTSVVQAVLTEDDIIDKELTWAAQARKKHQHSFYVGAHDRRGSGKTRNESDNGNHVDDDNSDWSRDDDFFWTQWQRKLDRIQLQLQQDEQPRQRQQLRFRRRNVEMPTNTANLRHRSDAPLVR
jgi:hypothetical protein